MNMERTQRLIDWVKERNRKREAELLVKALPPEFIEELKREVKKEILEELLAKVKQQVRVGGGGRGISDHGQLSGLGDDDHTQYLLANGSRAMTGNLDLAANKLLFSTALFKTAGASFIQLRDRDDTVFRSLKVAALNASNFSGYQSVTSMDTRSQNNSWYKLRSYYNGFIEVLNMYNDNVYFPPRSTPSAPVEGSVYYDSTANKLKVYNGSSWETITSS